MAGFYLAAWVPQYFIFTRLFFHQFSQRWVETYEVLGRTWISTSELDPQPLRLKNDSLSAPSPNNSLGCTLYPPETPHFTHNAHLPHSSPQRVHLRGVHKHRIGWRLVGRTLKFTLQTGLDRLNCLCVCLTWHRLNCLCVWLTWHLSISKYDDSSHKEGVLFTTLGPRYDTVPIFFKRSSYDTIPSLFKRSRLHCL